MTKHEARLAQAIEDSGVADARLRQLVSQDWEIIAQALAHTRNHELGGEIGMQLAACKAAAEDLQAELARATGEREESEDCSPTGGE